MQISELTIENRKSIDKVVDTHLVLGPEYMALVDTCDAPLVFTRDTIEGFLIDAIGVWHAYVSCETGAEYVVFRGAQVAKYQPRRDIAVIDCGDFRVVVEG